MIAETAIISPKAKIGKDVSIWHFAQIREDVVIGKNCIIGKNVYIDKGVVIGSNVKIQNNALIYSGTIIEDEVFVGPAVCFTNDKYPKAATNGKLKTEGQWNHGEIIVRKGASIGANSILGAARSGRSDFVME